MKLARKMFCLVVGVHPSDGALRSDDRKVMDAMAEEFGRQITFRATVHIENSRFDQENNENCNGWCYDRPVRA